ncbi:hypothetical protein [Escherichia coli]|uniref:hypothetical protein n=1 Tax=Escherichia coli TaxID=562 RepID=UPI002FCD18DB
MQNMPRALQTGPTWQLLTYRYQSKGHVEFADFNPKDIWRYARFGGQRSRYERVVAPF